MDKSRKGSTSNWNSSDEVGLGTTRLCVAFIGSCAGELLKRFGPSVSHRLIHAGSPVTSSKPFVVLLQDPEFDIYEIGFLPGC